VRESKRETERKPHVDFLFRAHPQTLLREGESARECARERTHTERPETVAWEAKKRVLRGRNFAKDCQAGCESLSHKLSLPPLSLSPSLSLSLSLSLSSSVTFICPVSPHIFHLTVKKHVSQWVQQQMNISDHKFPSETPIQTNLTHN